MEQTFPWEQSIFFNLLNPLLEERFAQRAEATWREEVEDARRKAEHRGIDQDTIDQAILGTPCGIANGGTLFEVLVAKSAGVTSDAIPVEHIPNEPAVRGLSIELVRPP